MSIFILILKIIWVVIMVLSGLWALWNTLLRMEIIPSESGPHIPIVNILIVWFILLASIVLFVIL